VLPAEVWIRTLPDVQSSGGDQPNLLSAIDPSLGSGYADIMAKKQEIAGIAQQIEEENAAAKADGVTPDDKANHQKAAADLDKTKSDKEAEVGPMQKKFIASIHDLATKVPADQQAKFLPAIANLLQALDDASVADGAALVRWPLALKGIKESIKDEVIYIAGDAIEERLGNRPAGLASLKAEVTIDGSGVGVKFAAAAGVDLGSIDMADLTKDVVSRAGKWFIHATTLPAAINSTESALSFEKDVLGAVKDAFSPPSGGFASLVVSLPAFDDPKVMAAVPSAHLSLVAKAKASANAKATVAVPPVTPPTVSASATVSTDATAGKGKKPAAKTATKKAATPSK
jgi:hypothetical protein